MSDKNTTQENIGKFLTGGEERDAIHIAVLPVVAGHRMLPGTRVEVNRDSVAMRVRGDGKGLGIVDPFLTSAVKSGDRVYVFLHPNTVTGMRHHWSHPEVDRPFRSSVERGAEERLRAFADRWNFDYDAMIDIASNPNQSDWKEYIVAHDVDLHNRSELGEDYYTFWIKMEALTGKTFDTTHRESVGWSCSC